MYSMTGYGKGVCELDGKRLTVEVKTVNHRYLDFGLKLPKSFVFLEDRVKKAISASVARGHIDMFVTFEDVKQTSGEMFVDAELAKQYASALLELKAQMIADGIPVDVDQTVWNAVIKLPELVVRQPKADSAETLSALMDCALAQALEGLRSMRNAEGEALKADLSQKLDCIERLLAQIEKSAPNVVAAYRTQLETRIKGIVGADMADAQRLATEVALFADRCAIDEEITRLKTHILTMRKLLAEREPVGRKLDFLVQEMNRETNTIGSKANDINITNCVLAIKNEIEKIREQAANVE